MTMHPTAADRTLLPDVFSNIGLKRPDNKRGLADWLTTVDHKKIGIMYGLCAFFFLLVGGMEALLIRLQLIVPENDLISAQLYNQLFTMHGTVMVFLAIMPLQAAFFNFLIPLQIGARDVALPRLNAFSFWTFVAGAIVLNISWFFQFAQYLGWFGLHLPLSDMVPSGGWFGYVPLTSKTYTGIGTDFWIMGLTCIAIASTASSLNFIVTVINMRAPGMSMMRVPVFTWMIFVMAFIAIFAFPPVVVGLAEMLLDRLVGTNFYEVAQGGQPILWQHFFWIFGHPEVYIIALPSMGIVSEILPTFSRKPLFGYPMIVFSGALIGLLGFAVWSHHMFTVGLGKAGLTAFALLTMTIGVPTGVKIFNWIGTLWGGKIRFTTANWFAIGFICLFMLGGFSGIMHAAAPADSQQHDTYFVVAHFHYVMVGGALMAVLGGLYYWFPRFFGKQMNERLGKFCFWLVFMGFNITFGPQHYLGLIGMPRRTHTYMADMGFNQWNLVSTCGALLLGLGIFLCIAQAFYTLLKGKKCPHDPWDARTLEWSPPTPLPAYNFYGTPLVQGRDAHWLDKHTEHKLKHLGEGEPIHMPSQSWFPLICGLGFALIGSSIALLQAQIPQAGILTGIGLLTLLIGFYGWALEGTGGYYLKPDPQNPKSYY